MTRKLPSPPAGLSAEAAKLWRKLHAEYRLDDSGAAEIIAAGLRAYDEARAAEAVLAREGLTSKDRYGAVRVHPCADAARKARAQWLSALKLLSLHEEAKP